MAKYIPYNCNQSMLVPITLSQHLYEGSLQEAIHIIVEEKLDLSAFDAHYKNDDTGRPAIHPKVLVKVILLAYSHGIVGSRRIEQACRSNVIFLALAGGIQPDHSTIAAFIGAMNKHIMDLFLQVLLICEQMDLLGGTHLALDGCKLPSNASKNWSATHKELKKRRGKLREKLKTLLHEHARFDAQNLDPDIVRKAKLERQIKRISRQAKRIEAFLENEEPKEGKTKKEIQSNVTDNQSAKMPTSHGVIQGYNAQAMVDDKHQIIVHAEAMGDGQDSANLIPMAQASAENLKQIGKGQAPLEHIKLTADCSYHNNKNIEFCEDQHIDAYIPDVNFRKRDERFKDQNRFKDGVNKPPKEDRRKHTKFQTKDFTYDSESDTFTCPGGCTLKLETKHHKMRNGIFRTYRIKDDSCTNCPLRAKCLTASNTRQRYICLPLQKKEQELNPSQRMQRKVDSIYGKLIYGLRMGCVEPVFGNLRHNKRLDRFTFRGKNKVDVQWKLFSLIHNMEKIARYGMA